MEYRAARIDLALCSTLPCECEILPIQKRIKARRERDEMIKGGKELEIGLGKCKFWDIFHFRKADLGFVW